MSAKNKLFLAKYKRFFWQKISAKVPIIGSSTVQLHGVDLIDI